MNDMQTMPVEDLVKEVRIKSHDMNPLQALVFNVFCNRLEQQDGEIKVLEARNVEALRREAESRRLLNSANLELRRAKKRIRDLEIEKKRANR
jgi:hypothetical protein